MPLQMFSSGSVEQREGGEEVCVDVIVYEVIYMVGY